MTKKEVDFCITGGGPAGMMLGVLLARIGARVIVLEKHKDFLRDFRGDTIHPSTMQILDDLGWLEEFLKLPHQPVDKFKAQFEKEVFTIADLRHLKTAAPYIAMMPQWDFLNFLARKGEEFPNFSLLLETRASGLVYDGPNIVGVKADGAEGELEIRAKVNIAADGRGSTLREIAHLKPLELGAPMDVLWFKLPREEKDSNDMMGKFIGGRIFIMLNRGDYWQCAFLIPKGENDKIRAKGLEAFRKSLEPLFPFDFERIKSINSFEDVKLLTVQVNRLKKWFKPGLLCIGDAAHAMSPIAGVGINLAVQDAVATANILGDAFLKNNLGDAKHFEKVQKRRMYPTVMTQKMQLVLQNKLIAPTLKEKTSIPIWLKVITKVPILRRIPSHFIGIGFRAERPKKSLFFNIS
ncbi:MAG: FAD-dependent oxidoreductase [Halobacteriovoraceae bacterium]|nr:FAD-dependent oxidoreductase [Halobacteriovoraceae bacterium]